MAWQMGHIVTLYYKDGTKERRFYTVLDDARQLAKDVVSKGQAKEATVVEGYYFKGKDT